MYPLLLLDLIVMFIMAPWFTAPPLMNYNKRRVVVVSVNRLIEKSSPFTFRQQYLDSQLRCMFLVQSERFFVQFCRYTIYQDALQPIRLKAWNETHFDVIYRVKLTCIYYFI